LAATPAAPGFRLRHETRRAAALARARLKKSKVLKAGKSKAFCAIGGTWRSFAKILQVQSKYPLHMVQHYTVAAAEVARLCDEIIAAATAGRPIPGADSVSSSRRELIPYSAAVMSELIKTGEFDRVVFSALGVREGYLYSLLEPEEQEIDPLVQAAEEMNLLRSRSPAHAADLIDFSTRFLKAIGTGETAEQQRLREVACDLADIGWRGHPDYRGEQSVDMVAYGYGRRGSSRPRVSRPGSGRPLHGPEIQEHEPAIAEFGR